MQPHLMTNTIHATKRTLALVLVLLAKYTFANTLDFHSGLEIKILKVAKLDLRYLLF
jgi:hypothetical protein